MDAMSFITSLSNAVSFYKTAVDLVDEAKITAATNALQAALTEASANVLFMHKQELLTTEQISMLKNRIQELEKEIAGLKEKICDKARYELQEPYPGTIAYGIKKLTDNTEPKYYLCQSCMDNGSIKSILQADPEDYTTKICPSCKHTYLFKRWEPV